MKPRPLDLATVMPAPHRTPSHIGPEGPVRAKEWVGTFADGTRGFLHDGGSVSYWLEWLDGVRLAIDPEHGPVQYAAHGDRLVWRGDQLHVVPRAEFLARYRPC